MMTAIAFMQIGSLKAPKLISPDGNAQGSEHFIMDRDKVKIWGAMTVGYRQNTYFEVWDRVQR